MIVLPMMYLQVILINSNLIIILALFNFAINCGDVIGPIFGGFMTNNFKFETACYVTSLLNVFFSLIYSFTYINIIKKYFDVNNDPQKEQILDKEYSGLKYNDADATKNKIEEMISYSPRNRGYSSSSKRSKKKSLDSLNQKI